MCLWPRHSVAPTASSTAAPAWSPEHTAEQSRSQAVKFVGHALPIVVADDAGPLRVEQGRAVRAGQIHRECFIRLARAVTFYSDDYRLARLTRVEHERAGGGVVVRTGLRRAVGGR